MAARGACVLYLPHRLTGRRGTGSTVDGRLGVTSPDGEDEFDLLAAKLGRPHVRSGTEPRGSLLERLQHDGSGPIVSVVAPAGYGKTTLLAQWADGDPRPFAWVSLDETDNDPKALLSYVV